MAMFHFEVQDKIYLSDPLLGVDPLLRAIPYMLK